MTPTSENIRRRIEGIVQRGARPGARPSDEVLFREYARRVALLEAMDGVDLVGLFLDPSELEGFDEAAWAAEAPPLAALLERLESGWARRSLLASAQWALLVRSRHPVAARDPALFEPLVRLVERGGTFRSRDGYVEVGGLSVPLNAWQRFGAEPPLAGLDDAALDALDGAVGH
jgi:hypothetical protein